MKPPLGAHHVVERSVQQLVKLGFLAFILALVLTRKPAPSTFPVQPGAAMTLGCILGTAFTMLGGPVRCAPMSSLPAGSGTVQHAEGTLHTMEGAGGCPAMMALTSRS